MTEEISETGEEEVDPEEIAYNRDDPEWDEHVISLIRQNETEELKEFLSEIYYADITHLMERLEPEEALSIFNHLDLETRGQVLLEAEETTREKILQTLDQNEIFHIIHEQESNTAVDLISLLSPEQKSSVLSSFPLEERVKITELLSYEEGTAGAIMAKEFVAVNETDTVQKAIQTIRKMSRETDNIHMVYVLDAAGKYSGHINLNRLILASPRTRLKRIMETDLLPIPVDMDQEEVANFFTRYDFITAPVVDSRGVMLGRITADDILDVMQEEASEDILRMGGVSATETLATPLISSSMKRIVWLALNLVTASMAAGVVSLFEATIEKIVILAALMPIVAGLGGNAGSQTMAVIIRNIALGEINLQNSRKVFFREITLGFMNGTVIGIVAGIIIYFVTGKLLLGVVIATAMVMNMLVASLAGTLFPLMLKWLGIDPAIASSIFVTACTDTLGFTIFLGLAYIALPYIL